MTVRRSTILILALIVVAMAAIVVAMRIVDIRRRSERRDAISRLQVCLNGIRFDPNYEPRLVPARLRNATGDVIGSWRFQLATWRLQFLEEPNTAAAWNSSEMATIRGMKYPDVCCGESTDTCILAVTGAGTAFDETASYTGDELDADLVLLIEVHDSGIHWMEPRDFDVASLDTTRATTVGEFFLSSGAPVHVGFADGEGWELAATTPLSALKPFFSVVDTQNIDREPILGPYRLRD